MAKKPILTPTETPIGPSTGGPGIYNGEAGYPGRTPGAGGPPEKVRDGSVASPSAPKKQSY